MPEEALRDPSNHTNPDYELSTTNFLLRGLAFLVDLTMSADFPVTWSDPADAERAWEWEEMHAPRPLPPLAGDYMAAVIEGINYRYEKFELPVRYRTKQINYYLYVGELLDPTADRDAMMAKSREGRIAQSKVVRRFWDERVFPTLVESYRWIRNLPVETMPAADLAAVWNEVWQRITRLYGLHFMTNAGSYQSLDSLIDLYGDLIDPARPEDALKLLQGLSTEMQRVQRDLYQFAERTREYPSVAALITQNPHASLDGVGAVDGGPEFLSALQKFLHEHGHLGQSYDDLSLPSWADEPSLVLAEVRKRLEHQEEDPEVRRQKLAAQAEAFANEIRSHLRSRPDDLRAFENALALAQEVGPLTEGHNYWLDRMLHAYVHRFALRVGRRLFAAAVIAELRDIFLLHAGEVADALRHPRDLRATVAGRKAELVRWASVRPPRYLGKPPDLGTPSGRFDAPPPVQTEAKVLKGIGASPGTSRGRAKIVFSPEDFQRVQPGDVLVCPSANPSFIPLLGIIAGLVTDTGGALSHAAVVAREFGVPAVVGTGEATRRVRDGQMVAVDGTAGEARLL